ncbi:UNVERIFIED_CONTAM: hypothetical protein HDU68_005375, partial [Siphonaria sp. JEL0065]
MFPVARVASGAKALLSKPTAARSLATAATQKVQISNLEKDKFINYQRIEDNLKIVRDR